jgi:penicillin-binding protein 1A
MTAERIRFVGFWLIAAGGSLALLLIGYLIYLNLTLPTVDRLENPEYSLPTILYDRHGARVKEIFIKRRKLVTYDQIPAHMIQALIAKEDSRFFDHHGIDPLRMLKAAWVNLISLDTVQGASTLTQQTARQFFLTLDKTWARKLSEILLALKIEREFSKQDILTLYLNKVNFGDAWGVEAAAEYYFDKSVEHLTLSESATLVGLLPAPNRYKPTKNPRLARQQRNLVLQRMREEGFITSEQELAAASEPIVLAEQQDPAGEAVAYYVELVRRQLLAKYGSKNLYEGGLHVYTAMDLQHQLAAHRALFDGLQALDRRRGYRGPDDHIDLDAFGQVPPEVKEELNPTGVLKVGRIVRGAVVSVDKQVARIDLGAEVGEIDWERMKALWTQRLDPAAPGDPSRTVPIRSLADALQPGDLIQVVVQGQDLYSGRFKLDLYQEPEANGAVYSIQPRTGEVLAMVGGWRFGRGLGASEFIRATQAERQPGSAFKPIIYAAAIDEGYSPATILDDSPRVFTLESGVKHIPKNYDDTYMGRTSLREALYRSRNVPTVQLVDEMGAQKVIEYARKVGFTTPIPAENIIALGTHSVKLDELVRAFAVFDNGGQLVTPLYILRVEDVNGNVLEENKPEAKPVVSEATAYIVTDILRDVVRKPGGTAYTAMTGLNRPAAGKTGTTQDYTDAWYLGFIPQLVAGVYVGYDDPSISLGAAETGSKAAAPIWLDYMRAVERSLPIEPFEQPPTVIAHRVDNEGRLVGACEAATGTRFEFFKAAAIPPRLLSDGNCFRPQVSTNAEAPTVREDPDL